MYEIGKQIPTTREDKIKYFDYWNSLLPEESDFLSKAIPLAQFALESNWSTSELAVNANNHAGHKFSGKDGWDKTRVYIKDAEEHDVNGNVYTIKDSGWRKYANNQEFALAHSRWFSRTDFHKDYYHKVLNASNFEEQLLAMQGTYATDIQYASKLLNIIKTYDLTRYDKIKGNPAGVSQNNKEVNTTMNTLRKPKEKITLVNSFGRHTNKPEFIVIHYVGAAGQAKDNANYFYNVNRNASAHIFIDQNETWRVAYDDMGCWHVGK